MSDIATESGFAGGGRRHLGKALYRNGALTAQGLSERLFALLFSGLVYPQIWEDPEIDMEAMALEEGHRIMTIGSGGCNVLSYLSRGPARIDVVDLNRAHVALNRLKLAAFMHLPGHSDVQRFFALNGQAHNSKAYDRFIARRLDDRSRRYWEGRGLSGRRRITAFDGNFYRKGLLGRYLTSGHLLARLHGIDPSGIMQARCLRDQRHFFDEQLAPLFERPAIRWLTSRKASLFGLGIPPAQYDALLADTRDGTMADVLKRRLEKLACHFPLKDNYFAWQAFARRYPDPQEGALPVYLQAQHYPGIKACAERVHVHHTGYTDFLSGRPAASIDRFVLLDAQDWMTDAQLNALWSQVSRTAAKGARVIFRTAAEPSVLPGRVDDAVLGQWRYHGEESAALCKRDRSAIYGGFHLYEKA